MKQIRQSWMLAAILISVLFFASCEREDNPVVDGKEQQEAEFQTQMDQALSWAQVYGPTTQTLAEEVAARHNGKALPLTTRPVRAPSASAALISAGLLN